MSGAPYLQSYGLTDEQNTVTLHISVAGGGGEWEGYFFIIWVGGGGWRGAEEVLRF